MPLLREDLEPDFDVVARLFDKGASSMIRAPLRDGEIAREVEQMVRDTIRPQLLLFLPAVNSFSYEMAGQRRAYRP